jgi:hypothetical protein
MLSQSRVSTINTVNERKHMTKVIKYTLGPIQELQEVADGVHNATLLGFIKGAKSLRAEFSLDENCGKFTKNYDEELTTGSDLHIDLITILGRDLTQVEVDEGCDLNVLCAGKPCRVYIQDKKGAGGVARKDISRVMAVQSDVK